MGCVSHKVNKGKSSNSLRSDNSGHDLIGHLLRETFYFFGQLICGQGVDAASKVVHCKSGILLKTFKLKLILNI